MLPVVRAMFANPDRMVFVSCLLSAPLLWLLGV